VAATANQLPRSLPIGSPRTTPLARLHSVTSTTPSTALPSSRLNGSLNATSADPLAWSALDDATVATIRGLAMDAVQKVGNGHPGTAMSLAPAAHLLFSRFLRHDPLDPTWLGRDRFVLSCGHSSLTLYIQLFLCGYGLDLADLKSFRTWGSSTPGHPGIRTHARRRNHYRTPWPGGRYRRRDGYVCPVRAGSF
jgi:hypothetical protein